MLTKAQLFEQQHKCAVCNEIFPSRSKLFDHIKDLDHAAPVPVSHAKGGRKKRRG